MIIKTDTLFPHLETDCEEMKELINLYNVWYKDTAFRSYWPPSNKFWDQLKEYCINHKELVVDFWRQIYNRYDEVGHFTYMLHELFPDALEVKGHCPLNHIEKIWNMYFTIVDKTNDDSKKVN